ncbi:MAG: hypothetical protein IKN71_04970 [Alphaproteobacteria bacterium]|nr:hypothetical protein [Alphaproteobacteria bacterium]
MPKFRIDVTVPGYYNDGEGHVYIFCPEDPSKGQKIIQRNCTLTNRQVLNVYAFMQEHKFRVMPIVHRIGGPNTYQTEDEYLRLSFHDAKTGKNVSVSLNELPEALNPVLAKALHETGNEALQLKNEEAQPQQTQGQKFSVADIKKISGGKDPR